MPCKMYFSELSKVKTSNVTSEETLKFYIFARTPKAIYAYTFT